MTRDPSTITCLRCGNTDLHVLQYECPQCGKPNLKAISAGTMVFGSPLLLFFLALFGLIAAATAWSWTSALLK
jgi:primosomal protein N'